MSTLAARIADALRMHVHPHLSRPIIEEALRKEESAATNYDAGVPGFRDGDNGPLYSCPKCGTTHWMHGSCPQNSVEARNALQNSGRVHPYTCGNDECRHTTNQAPLRAVEGGWVCDHCGYTQKLNQ